MDEIKYQKYTQLKEAEFESVCLRCGSCCGASDDPCLNLIQSEGENYFCKDYRNRLGRQKTVSGNEFTCIPIRTHIRWGTLRPGCAYLKFR